jgi:hypothetical protein
MSFRQEGRIMDQQNAHKNQTEDDKAKDTRLHSRRISAAQIGGLLHCQGNVLL